MPHRCRQAHLPLDEVALAVAIADRWLGVVRLVCIHKLDLLKVHAPISELRIQTRWSAFINARSGSITSRAELHQPSSCCCCCCWLQVGAHRDPDELRFLQRALAQRQEDVYLRIPFCREERQAAGQDAYHIEQDCLVKRCMVALEAADVLRSEHSLASESCKIFTNSGG